MRSARALQSLLLALVLAGLMAGPAAADALDPSFGSDGLALPGPHGTEPTRLVEDGRGRILGTAGGELFWLVRYLADGASDLSFGHGGSVQRDFAAGSRATDLDLLPDGDIVASGETRHGTLLVARFGPDGAVDQGFGDNGQSRLSKGWRGGGAQALSLRPGGGILVAGYAIDFSGDWTAYLLAYRADGSRALHFGRAGAVRVTSTLASPITLTDLAVRGDGRIRALGVIDDRVMVLGLRPDGRPDPSFGSGDGRVMVDAGASPGCGCVASTRMAIDRRGRILVSANRVGPDGASALLVRLRPDGRRDRGFGRNGILQVRLGRRFGGRDLTIQRNGKIVLAGFSEARPGDEARAAILRLLPDGRPDRHFGPRGFFTKGFGYEAVATAVLARRDGSLVVGGRANAEPPPFFESPSIWDAAEVFLLGFRP